MSKVPVDFGAVSENFQKIFLSSVYYNTNIALSMNEIMEDLENGTFFDVGTVAKTAKNHTVAVELSQQFEKVLSKTTQGYQCCRKKSASSG